MNASNMPISEESSVLKNAKWGPGI